MTFKDINQKFTETVAEYMAKGYMLNTATMAGSQGEYGKIDLTDGKEIIRVLVEDFRDGGIFDNLEGIRIVTGRCTDRIFPNDPRALQTIWNSHLEILDEQKFYKLNYHDAWYGTNEEAVEAHEKQGERFDRTDHYGYGWRKEKDLTSDKAIDIVLPFIRRELGIKRVSRNDVKVWKCRKDDRSQYRVEYRNKVLVLE